ncbi:phosphoethanolamine N-methyltransferase 3 [Caerostris extrusa]|uniref:phosphoethanolamine N-methyltransferase n=1 Tax=Caerostris extrusa TaxID=172846 RepID=A0AAV4MJU3_CAEEX|nr:phosphoethanolamine N-methyltransferase 3 [Caerostris extrusa]
MHHYWQNFAPSLESMMLDKTASTIHIDEQEEILSLLPSLEHKRVLELGAGIGVKNRGLFESFLPFTDHFTKRRTISVGQHWFLMILRSPKVIS